MRTLIFNEAAISSRRGLRPVEILASYLDAEFLPDTKALVEDVLARYSLDLEDQWLSGMRARKAAGQHDPAALLLLDLPDEEFLTALEHGAAEYAKTHPWARDELLGYAERALAAHGLPYKLDGKRFEWVGDRVVRERVIEPALEALGDVRLRGAREEFADALGKRRAGGVANYKDAIHEAANAVESTVKVLLDERGVPQPNSKVAASLSGRLVEAKVVAGYLVKLLCAAADMRNHMGGHGQGGAPIDVPAELADAAIGSAASAIVALAIELPPTAAK